ncbi:hypothetical protein ACTXGZ_12355 [Psychrobacter celer]|uniref:hypothetical protein n=1 Tax=Psychrobacter celer TaxID=306572 RepID=UPI003FD3C24F
MTQKSTARHHFLIPSKTNITVHPSALSAHNVWLKFHPGKSYIQIRDVDKYHKPPVRVIRNSNKDHYLYFDHFERMSQIFQHESKLSQPFIVIKGHDQQIVKMAWSEVLALCFYRDVNHVLLWQHLKKHCAQSILRELMDCDDLRAKDYCQFADIDHHQYEYQQRSLANETKELGLEQDMGWLYEK